MIENTSHIDKAAFIALHRISLIKRSIPIMVGFELVFLTVLAVGLAYGITRPFLWIVPIVYPVVDGFMIWVRLQSYMRSDKRLSSTTTLKMTFHDDGVDHESHGPAGESKGRFTYASFHHALIAKKYVFLYQNVSSAYPVERAGFTQGSAADMVALLKRMGVKVVGRL
ncbi:MAG TPA: hypothetical protein DCR44_03805 [Acholeplasmatales bacterium]|nr:MAG: hypothetical protein A2Y16_01450 [Tenericutes bacterium GWF2_57_13]HAQ56508.1 hypothetical protein [Acholeplasmatales bacterium]